MRANAALAIGLLAAGATAGSSCATPSAARSNHPHHEAAVAAGAPAKGAGETGPEWRVNGKGGLTRGYGEPTIPPACVTLVATKTALNGTVSEADEKALDTERIQDAINNCPRGQSVKLTTGDGKDAFVSGPLNMTHGVTLWIDAKTTLFASRDPRDFDMDPGTCGTDELDDSGGCKPLIMVNQAHNVGIMGEGTIDGRGGEPMIGGTATWWDVAQHAKVGNLKHSNPRLIDVRKSKNFTLYKLHIENSPKFHAVINAQGFVVWGITLLTPSRPFNSKGLPLNARYARNTDGVDPSAASNGVIAYNYIATGDDQIAIKGGNSGPTTDVTIAHNRFGTGHGMSIGSETNGGVANILVYDMTIDGAMPTGGVPRGDHNGIRIKSDSSRGGLVTNIVYRDVCIRDMVNPILLSPYYSKATGAMIPDFKKIVLQNVKHIRTPGTPIAPPVVTLTGYDEDHILDLRLDNVVVEGLEGGKVKSAFANVMVGKQPMNIPISGKEVRVIDASANSTPATDPCAGKFPALPGTPPVAQR